MLAGSDMHAFASSASSLSNTGEPSPAGTFLATHSTTPPIESPVFLISSMRSIMRSAPSGSGQRTMFASTYFGAFEREEGKGKGERGK